MKCILMNKNQKIMLIEYNSYNVISKIYEIYNIEYAPLAVFNASKNRSSSLTKTVNDWFRGRGIPSWRKDLEKLLDKLGVSSSVELLNKYYGLSLSDQYWLKGVNSAVKWEDINFFTNDFEYEAYLDASLDSSSKSIVSLDKNIFKSPNNTTDGMLQKGWIIESGKRVLVKGTYTSNKEEPINEYLASQICKRLGFDYCNYEVEWSDKTKLISKCNDFINENEELISAYDIYNSEKKPNNISDYEFYIQILEKHNVPNARENMENLFILDYLMLNNDRHLKNFGIIRNVNTLKWEKVAPIFDTGESMQCDKYTDEINFSSGKGKFFSNTDKDYEDILKIIGKNILRVDLSKLKGICDDYRLILEKYQDKLDMSDKRKEKLVSGLNKRITKLSEFISNINE
ncbi:MAG: HipA domain-containing protein [Bacilli bacterium]|nr:HipA domain-containing protein [Bacilli bacterium]